jgi:hypothetical protein
MSVWLMVAAGVITLAVFIGFIMLRFERKWAAIFTISIGTLVGVELIERGYDKISPLQSGYAAAESIRPHLTADTRLYTVETYDQSLPFYLSRTFTMVNYTDEFTMGQQREPDKYLAATDMLPAAWNQPGRAIALIPPNDIDKFSAMGLAFTVIHRDPRRAVILKSVAP